MVAERATMNDFTVVQLLERAESLVGAGADAGVFAQALLAEFSRAIGQKGVALWRCGVDDTPNLVAQVGPKAAEPSEDAIAATRLGQLTSCPSPDEGPGLLIGSELVSGTHVILQAAIEPAEIPKASLQEVIDILAELHRRTLLQTSLDRSQRFGSVVGFLTTLHADLSPRRVLNVFATDAAPLLSAKRIFVARRFGRRWSVQSATAVDRPNPRADDVRIAAGRFRDAANGDATDTSMADESSSQLANDDCVKPVGDDWKTARYAVLIESESAVDEKTVDLIVHHLGLSLENCRRAHEATLVGRMKRLPATLLRPSSFVWIAALAGAAGWLWFGQAELAIEAYGQAVPVKRAIVFAPEDGLITDVLFGDESNVTEGTALCVLRNDDLGIALERLQGEMATSFARLAALETQRGTRDRTQAAAVSAEREELRIAIESLEKQKAIVQRQIATLTVSAPIGGKIFVDGLPKEWIGRPVQRGQALAEIADAKGEWELRLRVPEREVRHVLHAMDTGEERPRVSFILETATDRPQETELAEIDAEVRVDELGELSTTAVAPFGDLALAADKRPGAGVVASIHCGKHRAGYVYLRRVIEFVQRQPWF